MDTTTDTEAQARAVERDIERTRNEMDATLSQLERRLAPSEIAQQGSELVKETVRERIRGFASHAVETVKQHPIPVALAVGLVIARYASRPSAEERLRIRADEDVDRAWRVVRAGLTRAKEQSLDREARLEDWARALASDAHHWAEPGLKAAEQLVRRGSQDAWRVLQHAAASSRTAGKTVRDGAASRPLATIALVGLAALLGRRWRLRASH